MQLQELTKEPFEFLLNSDNLENSDTSSDNVIPLHSAHTTDDSEGMSNVLTFDKRKGLQPDKSYLDSFSRARTLTVEEERDLVERAKRGERKARNLLTVANLKLVASIARRYEDRGLPLNDLMQEGSIGLMNAVTKFDPGMGHRFSTYASWWVREAITRALSNKSRAVRLPVHINELMTKVRRVRGHLSLKLGRQPSTSEIADELNESINKVERALDCSQPCLSLDQKIKNNDDDGCLLGEILVDENASKRLETVNEKYEKRQIENLLSNLNDKERKVVQLRFGLSNGEERCLREISKEMGMTKDQVAKISYLAMRKLRNLARREEFEGFLA